MARYKKKMKGGRGSAYNEGPANPNVPETSGGGLYASWDEVISVTGTAGDCYTHNVESGEGLMGRPAPGEPDVA